MIPEEETVEPASVLISLPNEELFPQGFEGRGDEDHCIDFANDNQSIATLSFTLAAPAQHEVGPSNKRKMRQVVVEVPGGINLQKKLDRTIVWLKTFIGSIERKKLESHSSITLVNDMIHSALVV